MPFVDETKTNICLPQTRHPQRSQEKTPPEPSLLVYMGRGDSGSCVSKKRPPQHAQSSLYSWKTAPPETSLSQYSYWFGEKRLMILVNVLNSPSLMIVSSPRRRAC